MENTQTDGNAFYFGEEEHTKCESHSGNETMLLPFLWHQATRNSKPSAVRPKQLDEATREVIAIPSGFVSDDEDDDEQEPSDEAETQSMAKPERFPRQASDS